MLGLDIAAFVIGTVADVWGIRADHLDIKKAKQEEQQQKPTVYPIEERLNQKGYVGELPKLGQSKYYIPITEDYPITDGWIHRQ